MPLQTTLDLHALHQQPEKLTRRKPTRGSRTWRIWHRVSSNFELPAVYPWVYGRKKKNNKVIVYDLNLYCYCENSFL